MKQVIAKIAVIGAFLSLSLISTSSFAAESVKIQTFTTHSRLLFSLDPSVKAVLKPSVKGFDVVFKGISLSDLGAPLGEEGAWAGQFAKMADPRVASLRFAEVPGGVRVSGVWRFPQGKEALVNPQMETFDFRESNPENAYVLDFWVKKGAMTLSQWKAHEKERAHLEAVRRNEEAKRERASRRIASEKRKEEIEDTTRFCREPLSEKNDIFLQFYPVHQNVEFRRYLPTTTPDAKLPYFEPQGKEEDAQYVRLALKLYRTGKYALTLKTLDFFDREHPASAYKTEMKFLRANAMIRLGLQRDAEALLAQLRVEASNDPVALHASMYLAFQQIEASNWLAASETFMWLSSHFADYADAWIFHLGTAEALYQLKQTDRALKEYQWVVEKGPDDTTKAEGALREADLFMERFEYDQALAAYYQAAHYFPTQAKGFAPLHLNRAEALYGLGQYDRAKEAFMAYLQNFPGNPDGWRAAFRLAEIDGRSASPQAQTDSRKWYYNTINSFPFSPGATLARLRLMPCGDHGGFTFDAAERYFATELEHFDPSDQIQMIPFRAMVTLSQVRTLIAFGKEPEAVDVATAELKRPGNTDLHEMLRATMGSIFRKSVLELLAAGKKYEALTFYQEKAGYLPKGPSSPEETDYLLKLSQAASDLGLGTLAKQIADNYAKQNAGRGMASDTSPDIESRLTASEQHFAQAKALWVSQGMKKEDQIRAELAQVIEESPYSYERELIYALIEQQSKKPAQALSHAIRASMLRPQPSEGIPAGADLRIQAWTADLQSQSGDPKVALDMYRNLEKHIRLQNSSKTQAAPQVQTDDVAASLGIPPMPALDQVILAQGDLLEKQGRWGEAAATYARAVDEKMGGNQALYQYARSLQRTGKPGDRAKARTVLEKLSSNDGDFWTRLAKEALADENTENTREGGIQ